MRLTIKATRIIVKVSGGDAWHKGAGSFFVAVDKGGEVLWSLSQVWFLLPLLLSSRASLRVTCAQGPWVGLACLPENGAICQVRWPLHVTN